MILDSWCNLHANTLSRTSCSHNPVRIRPLNLIKQSLTHTSHNLSANEERPNQWEEVAKQIPHRLQGDIPCTIHKHNKQRYKRPVSKTFVEEDTDEHQIGIDTIGCNCEQHPCHHKHSHNRICRRREYHKCRIAL